MAKTMPPPLKCSLYADGSFGLRARAPGDLVRVWFCGVWLINGEPGPNPGYHGNTSGPCVHTTKRAAQRCRQATLKASGQ